ncbi:MAG: iron-sulfur cluster assembly protein, partial [Dehalococcoidia bacterium]
MATEEQIRESLDEVLVPGAMRSLVKLNLVRDIVLSDEKATVTLASAALNPQTQDWLKAKVAEVINGLDGIKEAEINFVEASTKELNDIRNVVAIMSGKGGVGKSLVT